MLQRFYKMAFNFTAFTYIVALIGDAFLIFFAIFHVIAFDELKTDYKNPIDQCNSLNPVSKLTAYTRSAPCNVCVCISAGFARIPSAHLSELALLVLRRMVFAMHQHTPHSLSYLAVSDSFDRVI